MKNFKLILSSAIFMAISLAFFACSSDDGGISYGSVNYGGQKYITVVIGEQTWMAENLNFATESGSTCYTNISDNCKKYGRLYDWETAMNVCPDGWHLPTNEEWQTLIDYAGYERAGRHLKAKSGWNENGNGEDTYEFSALPGGYGYSGGSFDGVGLVGTWWSASEYGVLAAYYLAIRYYSDIADNTDDYLKSYSFSVRCVKD